MKWFCVTSRFYDSGAASAAITGTVEAEEQPKSEYKPYARFDLWKDYFPDVERAAAYIAETRKTATAELFQQI